MRENYPCWICNKCGQSYGKRPNGNPYGATWHLGKCDVCENEDYVTEPRDFGHLVDKWKKHKKSK